MNKGHVIILSGPSGVGKDTVLNLWKDLNPLIFKMVSCTTRPKREGELDQTDYIFMNISEFEEKIKKDYFIEYAKVYDHYYGTPKATIFDALEKGKWVILKIDIQGALNMMKIFPEAVTLFLIPPTLKELERRISKRAQDSPAEIKKRLLKSQWELEQVKHYQYIVINEDVLKTVSQLEEILKNI